MKNDIQVAGRSLPSATTPQAVFTHLGDNGVQIVNQTGATVKVILAGNNSGAVYNAAISISAEYYNLFVIGDETFRDFSAFLIGKDCSLTTSEGITPEISAKFAALTAKSIEEIKTFPSLFVSKNRNFGSTDEDHMAHFGMVTEIDVQVCGIKIHYQPLCSFPQQTLNDMAPRLGLHFASMANELDRVHWAIKRVDLVGELDGIGIPVPFPRRSPASETCTD